MSVINDTYAAIKARFHGGQVAGEFYKDPPILHSLGGRGGGRRDANGNLLGPDGKVLGRNAALFGGGRSVKGWVQDCGAYERTWQGRGYRPGD